MLFGLEINQLILFAILIGAIVLLFTEWIRIDLVVILIILALSLSSVLEPEEALLGFSSELVIMRLPLLFAAGQQIFTNFLSAQSTHHLIAICLSIIRCQRGSVIFFLNERSS